SERKVGRSSMASTNSHRINATTHSCSCINRGAYINQAAESQRDSFKNDLCMQLAENSKLHFLSPYSSRAWINAIYAPLKGCVPIHICHTSPRHWSGCLGRRSLIQKSIFSEDGYGQRR